MEKQEMLSASAKVAEHFLKKGVSERALKKISKSDLIHDFPELSNLIEVEELNYEEWAKHNNEEKSINYFKALVAFDMTYIQRKK
jgi:hypothetical protein